jgi:hypothetical protein
MPACPRACLRARAWIAQLVRANRAKKKEHLGKKALEKQAAREQRAIQKAQEQASREEMEAGAPAGEIEVQDNGPDFENMTEEEFMDWRAVGPSP